MQPSAVSSLWRFSPRPKSIFSVFDGAASNPTIRLSYDGERVFDRKAASSTIGAHICLFLWHVEHLSVKCRRVYHIGAIAVPF